MENEKKEYHALNHAAPLLAVGLMAVIRQSVAEAMGRTPEFNRDEVLEELSGYLEGYGVAIGRETIEMMKADKDRSV